LAAWKFFLSYSLLFGLSLATLIGVWAPAAGKWVGRCEKEAVTAIALLVAFRNVFVLAAAGL
jgi:hypothetical protein